MDFGEQLLRIIIAFVVLFAMARIMGRKEISQMTFFNFVSAIAIGTIAGSLVITNELSIRNGVLALAGWTAFTLIMGLLDIKSKAARKVTTGDPLIVIKDGSIMEGALRKARLDVDALKAMLREKNIFAMSDVQYAVFETNGKLSVMKKEMKKPVTKGDMESITPMTTIYPVATEVISDGKAIQKNLSKLNLDTSWLEQQLENAGGKKLKDVFYAEVQPDGSLYIDSRDDNIVH